MAKEIERKYVVLTKDLFFLKGLKGSKLVQGYLHDKGMTSRVRIADNKQAWLTLKGPRKGLSRDEFEYPIPLRDAAELLAYCEDHRLEKVRYEVPVAGHVWHVDVYKGNLAGLVTAEVELQAEDEAFCAPIWLGPEVTENRSYSNKNLARAASKSRAKQLLTAAA